MAAAASSLIPTDFLSELDALLFQFCQELQLPPSLYAQAENRYRAVAEALEAPTSPFAPWNPRIYPQGSMRLGTTIPAISGPRDLDFVLVISLPYHSVDPMGLLRALFDFFKGHGVYRDKVELKNRCVRIVYADEFYMDILPACQDPTLGGTFLRVPDRQAQSWRPSNPIGFANWFAGRAALGPVHLIEKAAPLPAQQSASEKRPLQLVVQLLKRWRDIYYAGADDAPISIVLTTLAALYYEGEQSISAALLAILRHICAEIATADQLHKRIVVVNPSHPAEDLSERWDRDSNAYLQFTSGIRHFRRQWEALMNRGANVYAELEHLYGEPVKQALRKRTLRLQDARNAGALGVTASGRLAAATTAAIPLRSHTFHGF